MTGLAQIAIVLLFLGVIVIMGFGMLGLMFMDSGPDWLSAIIGAVWVLFGWVALIIGGILGVIDLFIIALTPR
jgi:hypothetical protein